MSDSLDSRAQSQDSDDSGSLTGPQTEAVPFDPFADDEDDSVQTSAVPFDPFADDDGGDDSAHTAAVPFDPFADDDDTVTEATIATQAGERDIALSVTRSNPADPGRESRRRALTTFRERRSTSRHGKVVADGMVTLPFIIPRNPADAVVDPSDAIASGVPAPSLSAGDMVAGQYKIVGPLAHGGMGWIYLAIDHNVSDRWVVLKGMMSGSDQQEQAIAESERAFLADITHPGIVKIFNFIDDSRSSDGYIVMEYVGGPSLKALRRHQPDGVFKVDTAIGYILEVLLALDYLHSRGVVYNDLKPDNIIVTEEQVKLIDLGAVSGVGAFGHIYGTKGFQAPEISRTGPSVASDIYTVGRTLAVLVAHLKVNENGEYEPGIPSPTEVPVFRRYLSLYRLLLRATDPDPEKRFGSADAMANQLYGVLREILATRDGKQFPHLHSRFSPQRTTFGTKHLVFRTDELVDGVERSIQITAPEVVAALPVPLIDDDDPGARTLATMSFTEPSEVVDALTTALNQADVSGSVEVPLAIVRAYLDQGLTSEAQSWLDDYKDQLENDWRHHWYRGIVALLNDDYLLAQRAFSRVLYILPGEPAPKLALAATDELWLQAMGYASSSVLDQRTAESAALVGQDHVLPSPEAIELMGETWLHDGDNPVALRFHATRLYGMVWATNKTTVSSAFGIARQLLAEGMTKQAVEALDEVPQPSRHHRLARLTSVLLLISAPVESLTETDITEAAQRLDRLPTNEPRLLQVRIAVMTAALNWLRYHYWEFPPHTKTLFDASFSQRGLRRGLEAELRTLARSAHYKAHRYELVDIANAIRPRTWW